MRRGGESIRSAKEEQQNSMRKEVILFPKKTRDENQTQKRRGRGSEKEEAPDNR